MAAQSIGERASQLTLRTKHTSGVTDINLPDWVNIVDGYIVTKTPVIIVTSLDGIIIRHILTGDEVALSHSTIEIICERVKTEVIATEADDRNAIVGSVDDGFVDDDESLDSIGVESIPLIETTKYTISDVGKIAKIQISAHDVVAAVADFSRFLRALPKQVENDPSIEKVLDRLIDCLGFNNIHSIHYEILLRIFCRKQDDITQLHCNYPDEPYVWIKEAEVLDNMLLQSMIFEKFNQKLAKLLISDPNTNNWKSSIFLQLTTFNFSTKVIDSDPAVQIVGVKE
jgi:hypothetical protein